MNYDDFFSFTQSRRAIRKYKNIPIKDEDINKILLAGIQAPSGTNLQGWKFRVVNEDHQIKGLAGIIKEKIEVLAGSLDDGYIADGFKEYGGNFYFFENAPLLIMVYSKELSSIVPRFFGGGRRMYKGSGVDISVGMVMQNMMLAAWSLGIGSCPLTGPLCAESEINEFLPLPKRYELAALLTLGYPEVVGKTPGRKSLEKFIV